MYQYHKWLRSFHAVAKTGSFTLAAEYLSVGQPTVSEQVNALENTFSVELFHRRGRYIEMSAAGHKLYAITQGLFGQEDEAVQLLQSFKQRKTGMLRLGAVSPPIAMNLTYELMQRHPDIELETSFSSEKDTLARLFWPCRNSMSASTRGCITAIRSSPWCVMTIRGPVRRRFTSVKSVAKNG